MKKIALFLFFMFCTAVVFAQDGIETGTDIWEWSPKQDYHNAIGVVKSGGYEGTFTVFKVLPIKDDPEFAMCFGLTAAHIFHRRDSERKLIPVKEQILCDLVYNTGMNIPDCMVIKEDLENDISLIIGLCPKDLVPIDISGRVIRPNDKLEFCGFGGRSNVLKGELRHFFNEATWTVNPDRIVGSSYYLYGDSGGPILDEDHKIVGVITCGKELASAFIKHEKSGWSQDLVFPSYGCGLKHIKALTGYLEGITAIDIDLKPCD